MKNTRRSLITSTVCLLLCVSMFVGSTFAWFTDSVTSGVNQIVAGNLDVELYHKNVAVTDGEKVDGATNLFKGAGGKDMLWEPGAMSYEVFTVKNVGSLALKYNMSMLPSNYNYVVEAGTTTPTNRSLLDVLKVLVFEEEITIENREAAQALYAAANPADVKSLADFASSGYLVPTAKATTAETTAETTADKDTKNFTVLIYWPSDTETPDGDPVDNDYNLKNGAYASDATAETVGQLHIDLGINLVATQYTYEYDSFDNQYDLTAEAQLPSIGTKVSSTKTKTEIDDGDAFLSTEFGSVTVPKDNLPTEPDYSLRLDIERIANIADGENAITVESGNTLATYDVSLVKIVEERETPMSETEHVYTVTLFVGKFNDVVKFYHNHEVVTNYTYDPNTGYVTFKTNSFSPYATEYMFAGGVGDEEHPYLIANREQMVAIGRNLTDEAKNYKVADGVKTIDCSNWSSIILYGSFDGNGVVFNNLDSGLFAAVGKWDSETAAKYNYVVKNLNILNCNISKEWGYGVAAYTNGNVTFDNVSISGSITGTTSVGSFVNMGYLNGNVTFKNCISTCDLYGNTIGGFFAHAYEAGSIVIDNSYFDGNGIKSIANQDINYIAGNSTSGNKKIIFKNMNNNSDKYNLPDGIVTDGNGYTKENFECTWNKGINAIKFYKKSLNSDVLNNINYLTDFSIANVISFAASENATKADISLMIGPNDSTGFGNYLSSFAKETIEVTNGMVVSSDIYYSNITVNKAMPHGYNENHTTFNVNWNNMGPSYHVAYIEIKEYDSTNALVRISRVNLPSYSAS